MDGLVGHCAPLFLTLSVCLGSLSFARALPDEAVACLACHGNLEGAPALRAELFDVSVHRDIVCSACHAGAQTTPHSGNMPTADCGICHEDSLRALRGSRHGRVILNRATAVSKACAFCHGHPHEILPKSNPASKVSKLSQPDTCGVCHGDKDRVPPHIAQRKPIESYRHTIHAQMVKEGKPAAACADCHGAHNVRLPSDPASPVYHERVPETCGRCHESVVNEYKRSVHGKALALGIREAPACTDCHGEHTIRAPKEPSSSVQQGMVTKTCSGCHESQRIQGKFGLPSDRLKSYRDTYHGLASQRGSLKVANCASCHGWHGILPSDDPRSSVHRANLPKTCGQCHPEAGKQLSGGNIHGSSAEKHWSLAVATKFYFLAIPLTLGFMLLHNAFDFLRKALSPASSAQATHEDGLRMTMNERWQHAILLTCFFLLAYSGFALKFPESAWARLLAPFDEVMRKNIHRWTAFVFCASGLYHLFYVVATRRGRRMLKELLPRRHDAGELFARLFYYVGLKKTPPEASHFYHYAEKIEYWALVWGTVVMALTGGLILFNAFTLHWFPLWVADLATLVHYYEAILACLAIIIWHFYGVIFDPDVYPMNWAWLTGFKKRK